MPKQVKYKSPKHGSNKALVSNWVDAGDAVRRAHLERKGWTIVETREAPNAAAEFKLQDLGNDNPQTPNEASEIELQDLGDDNLPPDDTGEINPLGGEPVPATLTAEQLGITDAQFAALSAAGFDTEGKLKDAADETLRAIEGVGAAAIRNLRKALAEEK